MTVDTLRIQFNEVFNTLELQLEALSHAMIHDDADLPAHVVGPSNENPRDAAAGMFRAIDYIEEQAANETQTLIGALAASQATMEIAAKVNAAKAELGALKKQMDQYAVPHPDVEGREMPLYAEHIRYKLKRPRLHITQARRHILILDHFPYPPRRIGFTMASGEKKVQPIDWQTAYDRLSRRADSSPDAKEELQALECIPRDEVLAHVVASAPHVRANLAWVDPSDRQSVTRKQRSVSMPLLYPYAPGNEEPVITGPLFSQGERAVRLDVEVEREPVCPSIRVHRYLPEYRRANRITA